MFLTFCHCQKLELTGSGGAVEDAISHLPERQAAALTLCALQGHSQAEAADIMDVSVDALESLLARARRTLRASLLERAAS